MENDDENDVDDTSGYGKSGVPFAWLGLEDLLSVYLHARSGLVPAISGIWNGLPQEIL
jgi:hypothetical protein